MRCGTSSAARIQDAVLARLARDHEPCQRPQTSILHPLGADAAPTRFPCRSQDIKSESSWLVYCSDILSNIGATMLGVNMIRLTPPTVVASITASLFSVPFSLAYAIQAEHPFDAISNAGG